MKTFRKAFRNQRIALSSRASIAEAAAAVAVGSIEVSVFSAGGRIRVGESGSRCRKLKPALDICGRRRFFFFALLQSETRDSY